MSYLEASFSLRKDKHKELEYSNVNFRIRGESLTLYKGDKVKLRYDTQESGWTFYSTIFTVESFCADDDGVHFVKLSYVYSTEENDGLITRYIVINPEEYPEFHKI